MCLQVIAMVLKRVAQMVQWSVSKQVGGVPLPTATGRTWDGLSNSVSRTAEHSSVELQQLAQLQLISGFVQCHCTSSIV